MTIQHYAAATPLFGADQAVTNDNPALAGTVEVYQAVALSDFMQATAYLRRVALEACAPTAPSGIGAMLARLNYGGSGRDTGCLLLARIDGELVGFAVLTVKPGHGLEVTWLHAEDSHAAAVIQPLWDTVLRIKDDWRFPVLHVGMFVRLPRAMSLCIGQN